MSKWIVLVVLMFAAHSALAEGVFMVVKGDVKLAAKGKAAVPAKVGMKVQQADKIIAGKDARAKVVMKDKNILNISPDTEIVIEAYKFNEAKNEKNVSLNVIYGKMRATVNQKYDGEKNKFQVKTPSAVAGVRGTDFLTSYSPSTDSSKVVTFEGSVAVGSGVDASGKIENPVMVPAGTFSVASNDAAPTPPAPVPPQELQAMNRETKAETATDRGVAGGNATSPQGGSDKPKSEGDKPKSESTGEKPKTEGSADKPKSDSATGDKPKPGSASEGQGGGKSNGSTAPGGPGGAAGSPGARSPTAGGPAGPGGAMGEGPRSPQGGTPPPMMMVDIGSEIRDSSPPLLNMPDMPPTMVEVYKPPEIPTDLIQQNTNLSIQINVNP